MRQEKTMKVIANHIVDPRIELIPNAGASDRSWVWTAYDFSDGELIETVKCDCLNFPQMPIHLLYHPPVFIKLRLLPFASEPQKQVKSSKRLFLVPRRK